MTSSLQSHRVVSNAASPQQLTESKLNTSSIHREYIHASRVLKTPVILSKYTFKEGKYRRSFKKKHYSLVCIYKCNSLGTHINMYTPQLVVRKSNCLPLCAVFSSI